MENIPDNPMIQLTIDAYWRMHNNKGKIEMTEDEFKEYSHKLLILLGQDDGN